MKNLKYLFIAALMVFGFSACEDVPAPYDIPALSGSGSGNGSGGGSSVSTPEGDGTLESPYNPAGVNAYISTLEADVNSDEAIYVKGIVCSIKEKPNSQYGNATFYISADGKTSGEQFYVYRCYNIGNKKFTDSDVLNVGDEVIIYGKVVNYRGNTPETVQKEAYIYSHNATGEKEEEEIPSEVMTVAQALAAYTEGTAKAAVVKGYIVGYIPDKSKDEAIFNNEAATSQTNVIIADTPDETNISKCLPIQLPSGDIRSKVNLQSNPGNYNKMVTLTGSLETYFSVAGLKSVSKALFEGEEDNTGGEEEVITGTIYLDESFAQDLGSFTTAEIVSDFAWKYEYYEAKAYGYAKASGYTTSSQDAESWLISPVLDFSNETAAIIKFDYVINKGDASLAPVNHKLMITDSYTGDFYQTNWEEIDFGAVNNNNWDFHNTGKIAIPAKYMGKSEVVIAFKYISTTSASSTWEVKNVIIAGDDSNTGDDNTDDNEQGGNEPGTGGDNTGGDNTGGGNTDVEEEPLPEGVMSVSQAIAAYVEGEKQEITVTGYIVGFAYTGNGSFGSDFTTSGAVASNIVIAASPDEKDASKCLPVALPSKSDIRAALNLQDNAGNYKKKITITGSLEKYFSTAGLKSPTAYTLE